MSSTDFLQDKQFLDKLDHLNLKEKYVRLTVLAWNEQPIVEIQGKAMSGSVSLNGNSSLRRTASFSMFAEEKENDLSRIDQTLSINRKAKLQVGILNTVPSYTYSFIDSNKKPHQYTVDYKQRYGDIVWFPLGIFVLFDPDLSHSNDGVTININLKDKMSLLNGDAGGTIPASTIFSEMEDEYGVITHPIISQIIYELVNHFGAEDPSKIIIEDIDDKIKQVMKYNGSSPIYYLEYTKGQNTSRQFFFNRQEAAGAAQSIGLTQDDVVTYQYGSDVGFVLTDFTYPGELTCDPGASVTSVLDDIISVLGNYEYFYDVNGYFHFQEIKNYLNTTYTTTILNDLNQSPSYKVDFSSGKSVYTFDGTDLVTSISSAPAYSNVKNDFVVWGVRKAADSETEIPVRYHLAIDHKPDIGQTHYVSFYTDEFGIIRAAADFMKEVDELPAEGVEHTIYVVGKLTDAKYYMWDAEKSDWTTIVLDEHIVVTKDWREELYYQGVEMLDTGGSYPYYFTELLNEWPKLFNLKTQTFYNSVKENPSSIDFWLDMIDDSAAIGEYSVSNIGRRSLVVSEEEINCVFEQEVPDVVFIDISLTAEEQRQQIKDCVARGQDYIQVDQSIFDLLAVGGTQNSCYQRITQMLYQSTNMNETISIASIPIYYLEPNTRITVNDDAVGVHGDYMMQSISLPLDVDSTMSISAYKCLQKI